MKRFLQRAGLGWLLLALGGCATANYPPGLQAERQAHERKLLIGCVKLEKGMTWEMVRDLIPMPELGEDFLNRKRMECQRLGADHISVVFADWTIACFYAESVISYHKYGRPYWVRFDEEVKLIDWSFGRYARGSGGALARREHMKRGCCGM